MIDTVALKTKVLKLAFQGKLTEQTDENARELFKSVCDERDSLIKQKAIRQMYGNWKKRLTFCCWIQEKSKRVRDISILKKE